MSAASVVGTLVRPGPRSADRRTFAAEPRRPTLGSRHAHSAVRPASGGHACPHLRHAQDDSRLATTGEIRRALWRRLQSSHGPVRRRADQGQPSGPRLRRRSKAACHRPTRSITCRQRLREMLPGDAESHDRRSGGRFPRTTRTRCSPSSRTSCCWTTCRSTNCARPSRYAMLSDVTTQLEASGGVNLDDGGRHRPDRRRADQRRSADPFGHRAGCRVGLAVRLVPVQLFSFRCVQSDMAIRSIAVSPDCRIANERTSTRAQQDA